MAHKGLRAGLDNMSIGWMEATSGGEHEVDTEWWLPFPFCCSSVLSLLPLQYGR